MTELTGRVLYPGDPGWDAARSGFALWVDYEANVPAAVVFCQSAQDVVNAVHWAGEQGVPVRARAGRHSFAAYSSLVKDGLIIDVSCMNTVSINRAESCAVVGAGICMLDLFESLGQSGFGLPGATGPTVGVAGLTLGGGFGVTSRKWGLTCDNLLSVEMVTADGEIVHASETENQDLFWALRGGGGGNFGIATSFEFRVHPVANAIVFSIGFAWEAFDLVVATWQEWAPRLEDALSSFLTLLSTREIVIQGQFTGADEEFLRFNELLQQLLRVCPPSSVSVQTLPFLAATRVVLGLDPMNPEWKVNRHSANQVFKSTSALAYEPFPPDVVRLLKARLESVPRLSCAPSQPTMVQLLGGGGFPSRIASNATAVFHRDIKFVVQYDAYWTAPEDSAHAIQWATDLRTELSPYTKGAYVNYMDDSITDPLTEYYGSNLPRLIEIKRKWDPDGFFRFPQGIPR